MKKNMKTLLALLLALSLCMGFPLGAWADDPVPVYSLKVDMQDSWGDAWNGAALRIWKNDDVSNAVSCDMQEGATDEATGLLEGLQPGDVVSFQWVKGAYDGECSFQVYLETNGTVAEDPFYEVETDDASSFKDGQILLRHVLFAELDAPAATLGDEEPATHTYFVGSQEVQLLLPNDDPLGLTIRYTTDGTIPTGGSSACDDGDVVTINQTCTLTAGIFRGDVLTSQLKTLSFEKVARMPRTSPIILVDEEVEEGEPEEGLDQVIDKLNTEGWKWEPAGENTPAKLTLKDLFMVLPDEDDAILLPAEDLMLELQGENRLIGGCDFVYTSYDWLPESEPESGDEPELYTLTVQGSGSLTAEDTDLISVVGNVTVKSGALTSIDGSVIDTNDGSVTINGGTLTAKEDACIDADEGDITVNGGKIAVTDAEVGIVCGSDLTVNGGAISMNLGRCLALCGGNAFLNGGTLTAENVMCGIEIGGYKFKSAMMAESLMGADLQTRDKLKRDGSGSDSKEETIEASAFKSLLMDSEPRPFGQVVLNGATVKLVGFNEELQEEYRIGEVGISAERFHIKKGSLTIKEMRAGLSVNGRMKYGRSLSEIEGPEDSIIIEGGQLSIEALQMGISAGGNISVKGGETSVKVKAGEFPEYDFMAATALSKGKGPACGVVLLEGDLIVTNGTFTVDAYEGDGIEAACFGLVGKGTNVKVEKGGLSLKGTDYGVVLLGAGESTDNMVGGTITVTGGGLLLEGNRAGISFLNLEQLPEAGYSPLLKGDTISINEGGNLLLCPPGYQFTAADIDIEESHVYAFAAKKEQTELTVDENGDLIDGAKKVLIGKWPSSGGGGRSTSTGGITIPVTENGGSVDVGVTVSNGVGMPNMTKEMIEKMGTYSGTVSFDFTSLPNVTAANLPANVLGAITGTSGIDGLAVSLPDAGVTFDQKALTAIAAEGSGDVRLQAAMVDAKILSDEQKALVGDRPVLDLTLTVGGKTVSDFGEGTVKVSVPYTLGAGESADGVVVWYLNDRGILECVNGHYDAETGTVIFETDHFSKYVIGELPFKDVKRNSWYFDGVSFAFGNGLFSGTGEAAFSPNTPMSRAMLVTVLWRMEREPVAKKDSGFSDVAKGEWYANAVAWAAEQGIVSGYGDGRFGANDKITREQMAVILMNYAKFKGQDVSAAADLGNFADSDGIHSWAKAAVQWANEGGLISGTGGNMLTPQGDATRAQVAVILMRYINNTVI